MRQVSRALRPISQVFLLIDELLRFVDTIMIQFSYCVLDPIPSYQWIGCKVICIERSIHALFKLIKISCLELPDQ